MFPIQTLLLFLCLTLWAATGDAAKQKGFAGIVEDAQSTRSGGGSSSRGDFSSSLSSIDSDTLEQALIYGGGGLALIVGFALCYNLYTRWRLSAAVAHREQERQMHFSDQAKALGFKLAETKLLRKTVAKLSPDLPTAMLTTPAGRFHLVNDLQKRIRQREREVQVLEGLREKLDKVRQNKLHERESVRVEADLPVWVAKKENYRGPGQEQDDLDLLAETGQVAGQLLDLSEGGAALSTHLEVARGEMVEFWSRDAELWIPPIVAGVVQVQEKGVGHPLLIHLHFLSPPSAELRAVLDQLTEDLPAWGG